MRSTPVVGGGLFGEGREKKEEDDFDRTGGPGKPLRASGKSPSSALLSFKPSGHAAEIIVDGEVYKIRINDTTLKNLRTGYSGDVLTNRGIAVSGGMSIQHDESDVIQKLQGYIRSPLGQISEEEVGEGSETSSQKGHDPKEGAV